MKNVVSRRRFLQLGATTLAGAGSALWLPGCSDGNDNTAGLSQFCLNFNFVYRSELYLTSGVVAVMFGLLLVPNSLLGRALLGYRGFHRPRASVSMRRVRLRPACCTSMSRSLRCMRSTTQRVPR